MPRRACRALLTVIALAGCVSTRVAFPNVTPGTPLRVPGWELRPDGDGPFPAVVLLHTCHGVSKSTHALARWFRDHRYVALIVDSWAARGIGNECDEKTPDVPSTERFDDTAGALRFLHAQRFVDPNRIGVIGWSNGGVFSIAVVNGPSLERARRRGVTLEPPGFAAAIAVYPGGCYSLVNELVTRLLLVLMGDADHWNRPGPSVEIVATLRPRCSHATIHREPAAVHYLV